MFALLTQKANLKETLGDVGQALKSASYGHAKSARAEAGRSIDAQKSTQPRISTFKEKA